MEILKSKEELNDMALEGQKILLDLYKNTDWSSFSLKSLFNFTKSQMVAIRRGRASLKKNPDLPSKSEWINVIETSLDILHSCILQVNFMILSEEIGPHDLPTGLVLIADYIKLCNDEEDLRDPKHKKESTTLDGETIENKLESYLD